MVWHIKKNKTVIIDNLAKAFSSFFISSFFRSYFFLISRLYLVTGKIFLNNLQKQIIYV